MTTLQQQARALGDPTRHAIYRYVADSGASVGIAELTEHFKLNHNAIRQHLAKLVDAGLVIETVAKGAGPGRPRLLYEIDQAADSRWGVNGPYERLSLLLAEIIRTGDSATEVGRRAGMRLRPPASAGGDPITGMATAMAAQGFDPEVRAGKGKVDIVLHRCPFESTALADPETVCTLHLGIAEGLAVGTGSVVEELIARDPRPANCRVRLRAQPAADEARGPAEPMGSAGVVRFVGRRRRTVIAAADTTSS
jgi:predicted ArsR family transcriptional regulator